MNCPILQRCLLLSSQYREPWVRPAWTYLATFSVRRHKSSPCFCGYTLHHIWPWDGGVRGSLGPAEVTWALLDAGCKGELFTTAQSMFPSLCMKTIITQLRVSARKKWSFMLNDILLYFTQCRRYQNFQQKLEQLKVTQSPSHIKPCLRPSHNHSSPIIDQFSPKQAHTSCPTGSEFERLVFNLVDNLVLYGGNRLAEDAVN